jgi:hypothetical protein
MKIQSPADRWDRETTLVSQIAAAASLVGFLFYFRHGDLLLYGDAVAHINIARRVIDSHTPGLLQLGTVWLPLPHLLMIPFLFSDSAWQSGIAGSIPSMCAYVLGTAGVFRLVRSALRAQSQPESWARASAWFAAAVYAANPNLFYLQATAMTEPIYLALFIWAVVHFAEFAETTSRSDAVGAGRSLRNCGLCLLCACLTRYDGWLLAGAICVAAAFVILQSKQRSATLSREFGKLILLAAAAPALWLGYNAIVYRNPLEFANGPFSARAIEQKSTAPAHPGSHDLPVAFSYFLKSAELNMADGNWGKLWVALLLGGTLVILIYYRGVWPLLILWVPVAFYMLSIAYGGVPIYLPVWWPFSFYNTRYGLELLPAFAVFAAVSVYALFAAFRRRAARVVIGLAIVVLAVGSYAAVWRAQPICYREAWINSRTRVGFETELASTLMKLPHDSSLLMYLGDHVGALQRAGVPLRRAINEGNHRPWKKPSDAEGLWERALADPKQYADYVIAIDNDPVATQVEKRDLSSVVVIHTIGEPPATIYWTHRPQQ